MYPSDVFFPTGETHIPCDMCFPSGETHIPSDMGSFTWETHISGDLFSPTAETHIASDMCSSTSKTHFACDMFPTPETHILSDTCIPCYIFPPLAKHISTVICFSLPGKHIVTWVVLPIEIKKSRWQGGTFSLQVNDWVNLSSILTADLSFEYMDIKTSKKCPWTPSFLSLSTSFCQGIQSSVFLKSTRMGYWFRGHEGERNNINNI